MIESFRPDPGNLRLGQCGTCSVSTTGKAMGLSIPGGSCRYSVANDDDEGVGIWVFFDVEVAEHNGFWEKTFTFKDCNPEFFRANFVQEPPK